MYRKREGWERTISVNHQRHPLTDAEVRCMREGLERYVADPYVLPSHRRVARGLLYLLETGDAPREFDDLARWREQQRARDRAAEKRGPVAGDDPWLEEHDRRLDGRRAP